MITYENWHQPPFPDIPAPGGKEGSLAVLRWAYETYGDDLVYACSFGAESMVMLDLITTVYPDAHVVFLDTGLHFKETYETIDAVKERFPSLNIKLKTPELSVAEQAEKYGDELWKHQPNRCCYYRKVKPLEDTLSGATAWISGLRREQSPSRANTEVISKDERFQSVKVCPLVNWTWDDIWAHIKEEQLPYNRLHDEGYPSIGCAPCTTPSDDPHSRKGRWAAFDTKSECGLHVNLDNTNA
ncbi:phosphoadenylyl-sulfate reductase [Aureibacillus halotolerans]|uniref:Adenosine 5'-phosphosulfate reductase n=1 Tax=Aureibacillus halotolerans TaxID=1508390 RepID=A0A4R6UD70_9BACI|nr:phosphoadenylylsulfate reductase (thioredoxin) [Aureibacillus halotolerans]